METKLILKTDRPCIIQGQVLILCRLFVTILKIDIQNYEETLSVPPTIQKPPETEEEGDVKEEKVRESRSQILREKS